MMIGVVEKTLLLTVAKKEKYDLKKFARISEVVIFIFFPWYN